MIFFQNLKKISFSEWRFVWPIAILVVLFTTIPYLYGYLTSPGYFLWSSHSNFGDVNVYLSSINQARNGSFFLENLFTSEFSHSFSFRPLFLLLGLVAKITQLPNIFIFQLARIIFGLILLLFSYFFISYFLIDKLTRKICFLLLAFGSGVGALVSLPYHKLIHLGHWELFQTIPADLYLPEANIFVNIFYSPILPLALLLDLVVLYWFINPTIKYRHWLSASIYFLIIFLGFIHPFDLVALFIICGFFTSIIFLKHLMWNEKEDFWRVYLIKFGLILAAIFTSAIYYLFLTSFDPSFLNWGNQNVTESPRLMNILLGYGFILLFAIFSLFLINLKNNKYLFLLSWIIILFVFAYIPFQFQRRLLSSLFIPLCILAAIGLVFLLKYIFSFIKNKVSRGLLIFLVVLFFSLSNISVVWSNIVLYSQPEAGFHLSPQQYSAIEWLDREKNLVILATPFISNIIPGLTLNKVYVGHVIQSKDYAQKYEEVSEWFFKINDDDEEKKKWLKDKKIDYIFHSDYEKSLGDFNPKEKDYLQEIYSNSTVQIYRVL